MSYVNLGDLALFRGYIKVEIDRASDIKLRVPYISSSDITVGSTIYLPSRPNSTQLIIFTHQTTTINSLHTYNYKIYYSPQNTPSPNSDTTSSQQQQNTNTNTSSVGKIVGGVVGGVGLIIVLVIVYVVWRKRQGDARVFGTVAGSESVIVIKQQTQ
jgi:hypothetical protein